MLAGHLAVALGTRQVEPELPLWTLVAAVFWLDLMWPLMLLAGVETVRVSPGDTAFTNLAFEHYPWTHSLLAAFVWSAAAVGVARTRYSWRGGLILGALVLSHWVNSRSPGSSCSSARSGCPSRGRPLRRPAGPSSSSTHREHRDGR